jgi:hypothetical protein
MTQLQKNQEKLQRNPWGDLVVDCLSGQTVRLPSRQDLNSELHNKNMESQESRAGGWGREREREREKLRESRLTRGVSHSGLSIHIKKYLKEKEELWKFNYFTMQKKKSLQKNPLRETKILQDIITLQVISRFNTGQNIIFQKSSYQNYTPTTT